jgi:signal recognition particle GTPase
LILDSWSFFSEKFLKRLLGRNDVEDALKRLDKLTQDEAKMATAEVLNNVKMLVDGMQREFFRSCNAV